MQLSMPREELKGYIERQMNHYFPDQCQFKGGDIDCAFELALLRLENCFKYISVNGYSDDFGQTYFSHLHSDQMSQFLYYFSNSLWKESENKNACDKLILFNKMMNGMFFSYKGNLPDIFIFVHPVGTILGNAVYNDFLVVLQNVTVNTRFKDKSPTLGRGVFLGSGAKIIGNMTIGNYSSIGADVMVYQKDIPDNSIVYRDEFGKINITKKKNKCTVCEYFRVNPETCEDKIK